MCWNKACTTPCAELGKQDFLFPEKSSYIRLWTKRETVPSTLYCGVPPLDPGAQVSMFLVPNVLLTDPEVPSRLTPTPHPSQG